MQLPAVPVEDWADITLDMEALQGILTTPGTQLPFLQLLSATEAAVNWGTVTFTFTASATSASQTVTHSLGRAPLVFLQSTGGGVASAVTATTTSTFTAVAFVTANTAFTGSVSFYWVTIG